MKWREHTAESVQKLGVMPSAMKLGHVRGAHEDGAHSRRGRITEDILIVCTYLVHQLVS